MKLILIGFAASYKTTVGKIVAERLQTDFWDTDCEVEKSCGKSVAEIFSTEGEQCFRQRENGVLDLLQNAVGVVSCGGGVVLSPTFQRFAQNGVVVWLQTSAQTVRDRLTTGRPLFDGLSVEQLQQQISLRESLYKKYATFTIATDGKTSFQVAQELYSTVTAN